MNYIRYIFFHINVKRSYNNKRKNLNWRAKQKSDMDIFDNLPR
jgi:hypothetical protein